MFMNHTKHLKKTYAALLNIHNIHTYNIHKFKKQKKINLIFEIIVISFK